MSRQPLGMPLHLASQVFPENFEEAARHWIRLLGHL
jgi:hypothetical protein